jgi:hypothetical protein
LTTAVIVSLTLGAEIDATDFALAWIADNTIGIGSSLIVALALGPASPGWAIAVRARAVTADALDVMAQPLKTAATPSSERNFLISLAMLESSAEDAAAGSLEGRRKLRELNLLLACLLDLIVVARAILSREAPALALGHGEMDEMRDAFIKHPSR